MSHAMKVHELSDGWAFKQTDSNTWLPVRKVPTNVHLDLIDNKVIEDPFIGFNELACQWVGEKSWTYRTTLPDISLATAGVKHVLAFDGLDTYATVSLNGEVILESDNMFMMHRVDITSFLRAGENALEIEFKSALLEARKIKEAHPEHTWVCFNGESSRLAVRKAQYHYGWDWGPVLMTCGPWRAVRLESYEACALDLKVQYKVSDNLRQVSGMIVADFENAHGCTVEFNAALNGRDVFRATSKVGKDGTASVDFLIRNPSLWYPHGYGAQTLYNVTATLTESFVKMHSISKRTGFRKGELIQRPDHIGKSFYFRFNNIDIFCGGSDWIPGDSFTPRITNAKYRKWLETLVEGNQVMVRIWGGGIWEEDVFYNLCDELGILVWQDFMFACGNYPCHAEILESVEAEGVCQVKRLRHHPCVAIYAGNNEDYQMQETYNLTYDFKDKDPRSWLKTDFPARYIYEKLLPDIVSAHSPHVPYHPGSPWGDGKISSDPTVGDLHQWNVWHGTQEKYQVYDQLGGRFNSEFGLEAFPHLDTIKSFVTDPSQLYAQSHMLDFHNKASGHERRIATYVVENFRMRTELDRFIHLTQLSQAEALSFGYKGWRRQWGQQRHCGGALVWQLNDCWPTTSWSIVDYYLRKKPAYYAMKRALTPIAVAVKREHHDWSVVHARPAKTSAYECWVSSSRTEAVYALVELRFVSIATGKDLRHRLSTFVKVEANGTTEVFKGVIDNEKDEPHVLAARIFVDGELVSRDTDWPQPLKYLDSSDRGVHVKRRGDKIHVTAERPTKGLVFEEREDALLQDSGLDMVPGDEQVVDVRGLAEDNADLGWLYLGQP